jgi:hypothetical protein
MVNRIWRGMMVRACPGDPLPSVQLGVNIECAGAMAYRQLVILLLIFGLVAMAQMISLLIWENSL